MRISLSSPYAHTLESMGISISGEFQIASMRIIRRFSCSNRFRWFLGFCDEGSAAYHAVSVSVEQALVIYGHLH
jgi:hypothetical protein